MDHSTSSYFPTVLKWFGPELAQLTKYKNKTLYSVYNFLNLSSSSSLVWKTIMGCY